MQFVSLIFLLSLSSFTLTSNTVQSPSTNSTPSKKPICHKSLLNSYNLQGYDSPQVQFVEMCPGINITCCTKEDQLQMYGKYIQSQEQR